MRTKFQKYPKIQVGDVFNNLKVIEKLPRQKYEYQKYICLCLCGKITDPIKSSALSRGTTKSCGCLAIRTGEFNGNFTGFKEIRGAYWKRCLSNAKKRKHLFDITIEYAWDLFLKQEKKCALTKIPLIMYPHHSSFVKKDDNYASLDRIDSSKGYIISNVQWVHRDVNLMKNILNQDKFISLCKKISENN